MTEKPIVITRNLRSEYVQNDFTFKPDSVRVSDNPYITNYRNTALKFQNSYSIPTTKDEAWRRTDISQLHPEIFSLNTSRNDKNIPPQQKEALRPFIGDQPSSQIVIGEGGVGGSLSEDSQENGIVFTDLLNAEKNYPEIVEKVMGKIVNAEEGKFSSLSAAYSQHGILLYVPRGIEVEQPLHSLLWGSGENQAYLSHIMVYLEEGSSATYIHESASKEVRDQSQILHSGIVEIYVGPGASLQLVELQSWGENVWNFCHERAHVDRDGRLDWIIGAIGSHLTKNFSDINLVGEGSTGRMSGFYFTDHDQHFDHDTQQNHLAKHTTSDLLFKGALLGHSRSVWQGMIYVAPGADKADGYQSNRNLTLSPDARADSIPGLEILADDVRCTHGATVGRIDENQLFYLLSRGIHRNEAEQLIVEGFFEPIMERIPLESVRDRFRFAIQNKMKSNKYLT
jgi:Fe-S cluster assembly protein SufD